MSDDLNDLKQALQATTPTPEAARKAEHLMLAEKTLSGSKKLRSRTIIPLDSPMTDILKE
jgi:hypothetical protein